MTDSLSETAFFGRATRQGTDASSGADLPGQAVIGRVSSLLFDSLRQQAGSGAPLTGWRVEVVSVPLRTASRRRIRLRLKGLLAIVRKGHARVGISCESGRLSTELLARDEQPLPDGALPNRQRPLNMSIVVPRSTRPRTELRVVIFIEVSAASPQSACLAIVDSLDIEAI